MLLGAGLKRFEARRGFASLIAPALQMPRKGHPLCATIIDDQREFARLNRDGRFLDLMRHATGPEN